MGASNLSGAKRAEFNKRAERRNSRDVIDDALAEMRTEEGLDQSEAMNDIALSRRQAILNGTDPDNPSHSMTIEQLDEAVKTLGVLTPDEREQYHSTAFNINYYMGLAREMQDMDDNPLDELVEDGSADNYYLHDEQDRVMV